jgi:hypothetical protein
MQIPVCLHPIKQKRRESVCLCHSPFPFPSTATTQHRRTSFPIHSTDLEHGLGNNLDAEVRMANLNGVRVEREGRGRGGGCCFTLQELLAVKHGAG